MKKQSKDSASEESKSPKTEQESNPVVMIEVDLVMNLIKFFNELQLGGSVSLARHLAATSLDNVLKGNPSGEIPGQPNEGK